MAKKVWLGQVKGDLPIAPGGLRVARTCTECKRRGFGDPEWDCPEHPGKAVDQANNTYMGKTTASIVREEPPKPKARSGAKRQAAKS